jgi:hypothetical protein
MKYEMAWELLEMLGATITSKGHTEGSTQERVLGAKSVI